MAFVAAAAAFSPSRRPTAAVSSRSSAFTAAPCAPVCQPRRSGGGGSAGVVMDIKKKTPGNTRFDGKVASTNDALGAPGTSGAPAVPGGGGKGFTRAAEIVNGRYAMIGFVAGLAVELGTGISIYSQVKAPAELLLSRLF
ncbi:hypothetical protein MMPV_001919 [Pyropia vietnamensis]